MCNEAIILAMNKSFTRRTPRFYNGIGVTTRHLNQLMPQVLEKISDKFSDRPDLILAAWPDLIGVRLSPMTQAVSFEEGVLTVKVKNSTLYSLLCQHERPKLVQALREKFPKVLIKTILFRIG